MAFHYHGVDYMEIDSLFSEDEKLVRKTAREFVRARDGEQADPAQRMPRASSASSGERAKVRGSRSCIPGHEPSGRRGAYRHQKPACHFANSATCLRPRSSSPQ